MNSDCRPIHETNVPLAAGSQRVAERIDAVVVSVAEHWLRWTIGFVGSIVGLAVAAPLLRSSRFALLGEPIYLSYRAVCHQSADRSFHVMGEPLAFCQRDLAIFVGAIVATVVFGALRHRVAVSPLPLAVTVLAAMPMALDGSTQLLGLRESNWELRVVSGSLFALGIAWFTLPYLERGFARLVNDARAVSQ